MGLAVSLRCGPHPFPFRTRKLSRGGRWYCGCGRVGECRLYMKNPWVTPRGFSFGGNRNDNELNHKGHKDHEVKETETNISFVGISWLSGPAITLTPARVARNQGNPFMQRTCGVPCSTSFFSFLLRVHRALRGSSCFFPSGSLIDDPLDAANLQQFHVEVD